MSDTAAISSTQPAIGGGNHAPIIRHSKFFFDNTLVVIQIENVQFNVHKYQLIKSETFADMFAIADKSKERGNPAEGSSTDNPIKMEGVSASDFECLLTVLYATHFSTYQPDPEASLIVPAFRLANMWNFADLRAYLIPLAEKILGDVDKIVFAREFGVGAWITPAYTRLCQRKEPFTSKEAAEIGVDGLLLILRLRAGRSSITACCKSAFRIRCNECGTSNASVLAKWNDTDIGNQIDKWMKDGCLFTNS